MAHLQLYKQPLESPPIPIAIRHGSLSDVEQTIFVHQHNLMMEMTVLDANGNVIITSEAKKMTMSARRQFSDVSGLRLYDLRTRYHSKSAPFVLELPDEPKDATDLMSGKVPWSVNWGRFDMDVTVHTNVAAPGEEIVLDVKPLDFQSITVYVEYQGRKIAKISKVLDDRGPRTHEGEIRAAWEAKIAPGLDLNIIVFIVNLQAQMGETANR